MQSFGSVVMLLGAALSWTASAGGGETENQRTDAIPPHQPLPLEGVHAYTDKLSVAAGETIRFHVSSTHPYRLEVCRLGLDMDSPHTDEVLHTWKVDEPVMQPIHPGSYVHVEKGLDADEPERAVDPLRRPMRLDVTSPRFHVACPAAVRRPARRIRRAGGRSRGRGCSGGGGRCLGCSRRGRRRLGRFVRLFWVPGGI